MQLSADLVEFKPSPIHGTGGFAGADVPAQTRLIEYVGERIDKEESLARCMRGEPFIFHLDEQWDLDGNVEWNPARFLNHSCAPNCETQLIDGHIWMTTIQPVSRGDELTFNYGYELVDYREHPCRCGAPGCVGYIVAGEFFDHLRTQLHC